MPDNLMPIVISNGLGVGIIAGVVSGICYVFVQGFRNTRHRQTKFAITTKSQCCLCGKHFDLNSPNNSDQPICCQTCNGHACSSSCAIWETNNRIWQCKQCATTENYVEDTKRHRGWFKSVLTALQPGIVTVRMSKLQAIKQSNSSNHGNESTQSPNEESENDKEIVRDFIERLVGAMLGGNLDDTSVGRMYTDPDYDAMFDRYHGDLSTILTDLGSALRMSISHNLPITGQTPCTAHSSLKNIIRRVLRDASNMAIFKEPQIESESPETTTNRTYEDLLATAILNKVIDNYQSDLRRSSSGSVSSKQSNKSRKEEQRKRWPSFSQQDTEISSTSSVEEWFRSDSGTQKSLIVDESIIELSTSDEDEKNQYLHSHNMKKSQTDKDDYGREDWQDNWLFSRKGKKSPKPVSVPMLVPNPSTDYRALIGDRDADDTTDLSETGSDLDESDSVHDIKTILVESRTVIGGKNLLENIITVKEEITNDNEEEVVKDEEKVSEAMNNVLIQETSYIESDSLDSNTEKNAEYTEKYASFPRQISKDASRTEKQEDENVVEDIKVEEEPPIHFKGSYSEKEKQKWKNPVALENNPYSKENIDKRLNGQPNQNHSFGRDYYIREAKKASGGRKKLPQVDDETEETNSEVSNQSLPVIDEKTVEQQSIFVAVPAVVQEQKEDEELTEFESLTSSRPTSLAISTDSEDVRVFNIETGQIQTFKNITQEIIQDSKSPEGSKSFIKDNEMISTNLSDEIDNKFDENHNKTNKEPIMNISNHISTLIVENKKPQEEAVESNDIQLETSIVSVDIETKEGKISPELKESSKKYLQSLLKKSMSIEVENFATPPVSLQETIEQDVEIPGKTIEIEIEDPNILYKDYKSCIDLRLLPENPGYSTNISSSTSNLEEISPKEENEQTTISSELDELQNLSKPSVKDLKKLFDQEKSPNVTISRTKSNITIKPETRAHWQVHSLTARSLSKEFRREILPELQKTAEEPTKTNDVAESYENEEDELKVIPPCKSKIEYFELLKQN